MISIVTFKWNKPGYRSKFTERHVSIMRNMVERHYPDPHRFICITDEIGTDPRVEWVPIWDTYADLKNPTWPDVGPSCYRRLKVFSAEFSQIAGERFVCIDLDMVITGDMRPLWNRAEDFIIYASDSSNYHYNGSMLMMTAGSRRQVWDDFDPIESPRLANAAQNFGSDQGWIQYRLGRNEAMWTIRDGIYAYRRDCMKRNRGRLPNDARVVVFHGRPDPWDPVAVARSPWIKSHYR